MKKTFLFSFLILTFSTICHGENAMLSKGDSAPEFSMSDQNGTIHNLSDYKGKYYVVLIFYPGDETPVCTQQLCEIRDDYSGFTKKGAVVFGVNPASGKSHKKFAEKNNLQFPLLIDTKATVAARYKVKGVMMNQRTVFVIDKDGKIIYAQKGKPPIAEILSSIPESEETKVDLGID